MPSEDLVWPDLGETSLSLWAPGRNTILQPPKPQITRTPNGVKIWCDVVSWKSSDRVATGTFPRSRHELIGISTFAFMPRGLPRPGG